MPTNVSGRLLLSIPDCLVECAGNEYRGTLALEYVAVATAGQLALRVDAFEIHLPPTQPILHQRALGIYTIPGTPAPATLHVPLVAPNAAARVVLDAFGVLLARFGVVHDADGIPPAHGRSDDPSGNGQVVDEGREQVSGCERTVVLSDLHASPALCVRPLLPEESATLLRSAHAVSRGIVFATTAVSAGMALASSTFVARTAPNTAPVAFSTAARRNIAGTHTLSAAAVTASARTTELILHVVDHTAAYVAPLRPAPSDPPTGIAALAPSADLLLATLADSGAHLLTHGTRALASSLAHRYGAEVGDAIQLGSETARNLGAVYSDARTVGRHALLVRVGQRVVSSRMAVLLGEDHSPTPL